MVKLITFLVVLSAAGMTKIDCKNIGDVASNYGTLGSNLPANEKNEGETRESCRMQCNWNGSCTETLETWTWKCNDIPKTKIANTFFMVISYPGLKIIQKLKLLCLG